MRISLIDYENRFFDYKDNRLDNYCCYCGQARYQEETTLDHVPSRGLLNDQHLHWAPQVRVCKRCNRDQSPIESYAYCSLSSWLASSHIPRKQVLPKAGVILASDRRLRKLIYSELNFDALKRSFWKPDFVKLDHFFRVQAIGHAFIETGELVFQQSAEFNWFDLSCAPAHQQEDFFRKAPDIYPELGSRAFRRLQVDSHLKTDHNAVDEEGFIIVEEGSYRFRVLSLRGETIVQSVVRERLATEVRFHWAE